MVNESSPASKTGPRRPPPANEDSRTTDGTYEVSVIVPVWQAADTLGGTLDALETQLGIEEERVQFLIIDNGSTDASVEIGRRFAERDPAQRIWCHEPKPGAYAARNRGLGLARGTYVLFTDADCCPEPSWIAATLAALREEPRRIVGGPVLAATDQSGLLARYAQRAGILGQEQALARGFLQTANLGLRRDAAREVGGFDESLYSGGDADFCWRLIGQHGFTLHPIEDGRVLHTHRETLGGLLRQFRRYGQSDVDLARRHGFHPLPEVLKLGADLVRLGLGPVLAILLTPVALLERDPLIAASPLLRALRVVARRSGQWTAWRSRSARHRT